MLKIGEVIKAKRKECELTQEELATLLGVTKAAVSKWETAESYPDVTLLPKIAEQFHITMDELFCFCPNEQAPTIINCYRTTFYLSDIEDRSVLDHGTVECRIQKYGIEVGDEIQYKWEVLVTMKSVKPDILYTFQKCIKPNCYIDFVSERRANGKLIKDNKPDKHFVCKEKIWEYNVEEDVALNRKFSNEMFREQLDMGLISREDIDID